MFLFAFFSGKETFAQLWSWDTLRPTFEAKPVNDKLGHIYCYSGGGHQVVKRSQTGQFIWQCNLSTDIHITDLVASPDSSFYIAGYFEDTLIAGGVTHTVNNTYDLFVARYNSQGSLIWFRQIIGSWYEHSAGISLYGTNLVMTGGLGGGTIYFGNQVLNSGSGHNFFLFRIDKTGFVTHSKFGSGLSTYGGGFSEGYSCESDHSGNIISTAFAGNLICIDGDTIDASGGVNSTSWLLLKFDSSLALQWNKVASSYRFWKKVKATSQNELYIVEDLSVGGSGTGGQTGRIIKSGVNGAFLDTFYLAKASIQDIDLDSCGNVYFTGWQANSIYIPPTSQYYVVTGQLNANLQQGWLIRDSAATNLGGTGLVCLAPNSCYVAGCFTTKVVLYDTLTAGTNTSLAGYGAFHGIIEPIQGTPINTTPPGSQQICKGQNATLSCLGAGFVGWYASPSSTAPLWNGIPFTTTTLSAGVYTYYAEAKTCSTTSTRLPITVTVDPGPPLIVSDGMVCHKNSYTIQPSGANSYTFSCGNSIITPSVTSSYTIVGSNGTCTNAAVCQVSVLPLPVPQINTSINFMCQGETAILTASGAQSYTWNTGANTNTISVSPVAHAIYSVIATDVNGCSAAANITQYVNTCLGVNDYSDGIKVFPSLVASYLRVEGVSRGNIQIMDCAGRIVFDKSNMSGEEDLDLQYLSQGVYLVRIDYEGSGSVRRIVKQ